MTGYVFDDTVLDAYGHGSDNVARLIAGLDGRQIRMAVPAITLAVAQAALSDEQCDDIDGVIDSLEHVQLDPLVHTDQITELSRVIGVCGSPPDSAAAHAIYVSKRLDWPIVTVDRKRWAVLEEGLPWPLELVELAEPEQAN
ncbi:hypothetical protein AB0H49_18325 [Nocardia sp. NPDC050713]|uniref:hypothetical protein n=1 Tax=Nocardia sp. NPDC050713 TaxID=3154511 RepID=UPI0033E8ED00